jgi:molybdate transport system substrate-binding protein
MDMFRAIGRPWVAAGLAGTIALGVRDPRGLDAYAPAREIAVAAASDLQRVLPELASRFERDSGARLRVSYGSSGAFFAQIQNGAPFDVFLSADVDYPRRLAASRHAEADSLYEYATGRLVLWTRKDSGIDVRLGPTVLRDARVRRVAIANPEHAPYGRAAVAVLRHEKLYDAIHHKLVLGENIAQAAQFAESGSADAGIFALSLAVAPPLNTSGVFFHISPDEHPPIRQAAIVLSAARDKETARQFLGFLRRPDIGELLERFGFAAPQASSQ